ncbi:PSK operon transcription factor [Caulobacter sp. SLTY]|uniref:type II toxin-antitoxin system VapB family antitoxin n=1 Tax=Caulobacter sp. SLTY TaxID=2683262 RepID=UPI001413166B|nr:type II toxin-antitoxin system VapB family antitoxin [Caulobacter sp. SLTY]NBB14850.1 PSK operon transcription factor [Caulobacter sp. SLTY]
MTLSIRDPDTDKLARELAARHRKPITEVVRAALEDYAAKATPSEQDEREARLKAVFARIDRLKVPSGPSCNELIDELYDEDGLPA